MPFLLLGVITRGTPSLLGVDHLGDFLYELEQVDTVLGVAVDDLVAADVRQVVLQDLFTQEVDQGLDVLRHLLLVLSRGQLREVDVGEGGLEKLDVELVGEEHSHVLDGLGHPKVAEDVISQLDNHLYD